jgi:hypothetical protein
VSNAEFDEVVEAGDCGIERALGSEGADVQFIDDGAGEGGGLEFVIAPLKCGVIVEAREAVDSVWLPF